MHHIDLIYIGAALLLGGIFVLAQVGADYGYITVDHNKIKRDVEKKLDINQGIIYHILSNHKKNHFINEFLLRFFLFFSKVTRMKEKTSMFRK